MMLMVYLPDSLIRAPKNSRQSSLQTLIEATLQRFPTSVLAQARFSSRPEAAFCLSSEAFFVWEVSGD